MMPPLGRRGMLAASCATLLPALPAHAAAQAATVPQVALLVPGLTNDASFNQAASDALRALQAQGRIRLEVRESMADPAAAEPVLQRYALRGTDLVIGHGIELSDSVLKVAALFPRVSFSASGGPDLANRLLPNVDGWTYDFGACGYLAGFVAGRLANAATIGMVGGPPVPFVLAAHKGFRAGVRESRPDARFLEILTGSFDDSQKAAEATRGMIAGGATVVWCSGDSMANGVAAAASSQPGVATLGVTGDAGGLAHRVNVTSVVLDMTPVDRIYLDDLAAGRFGHRFIVSGIGNKGLVLTPINPVGGRVPASLPQDVAVLIAALASGSKTLPGFF